MSTANIPYVLKENFLTVFVNGKPFNLESSHPTFIDLKTALVGGRFDEIPHLVSLAEKFNAESKGTVQVKNSTVFYKGRPVDNSLTRRMLTMHREGQSVDVMTLFMENLFLNPSQESVNELYDWLNKCSMPITDDGCFMAFKAVTQDYKDCHSRTIDNSIGNVVEMERGEVDTNRRNECSYGLHFCSWGYLRSSGFGGARLLKIKINPKDVVSIPADYGYTKGRCCRYEIVGEVDFQGQEVGQAVKDAATEKLPEKVFPKAVEPVAADRQTVLQKVLAHPAIKRAVRAGKIAESTLKKWTLGQLQKRYEKLPAVVPKEEKKREDNSGNALKTLREAAGLSLAQVAEELDVSKSAVWAAERSTNPKPETVQRYREAIGVLLKR